MSAEFVSTLYVYIANELGHINEHSGGDMDDFWHQPDIKKAKRILDWTPKVSLDDGMRQTMSTTKANSL